MTFEQFGWSFCVLTLVLWLLPDALGCYRQRREIRQRLHGSRRTR